MKIRMKDICLRHGCIRCCLNTEMPLSLSDIDRIKDLGFAEDFFLDVVSGSRQLKNLSGRCVFHNGQQCTIYTDRPEGCQLYPVIFDEDKGQPVLDSYCPYHAEFQLTPSISRKLVRLVRKLDMEKTKG
jgi:Fe-S-cluster containining protein